MLYGKKGKMLCGGEKRILSCIIQAYDRSKETRGYLKDSSGMTGFL